MKRNDVLLVVTYKLNFKDLSSLIRNNLYDYFI